MGVCILRGKGRERQWLTSLLHVLLHVQRVQSTDYVHGLNFFHIFAVPQSPDILWRSFLWIQISNVPGVMHYRNMCRVQPRGRASLQLQKRKSSYLRTLVFQAIDRRRKKKVKGAKSVKKRTLIAQDAVLYKDHKNDQAESVAKSYGRVRKSTQEGYCYANLDSHWRLNFRYFFCATGPKLFGYKGVLCLQFVHLLAYWGSLGDCLRGTE